jgi:hypothetical protein
LTDNFNGSAITCSVNFGKVYIKNSIIKNTSTTWGSMITGGVSGSGNIEIENCQIESNKTFGVSIPGGNVKISNSKIHHNGIGKGDCFGIRSDTYRCSMIIQNSSVVENSGTGIYGCSDVRDCFIGNNIGNGLASCQSIINSKIIENGGVGILSPSSAVKNCIISKNRKQGIYNPFCNITNCTIVDNNSVGIQLSGSTLNITNCIVRDNYTEQIKGVTTSTKITYTNSYRDDIEYFNFPRTYEGVGNIDEEPEFVNENDYHLTKGSSCIDKGSNDVNLVTEVNDIEGNSRIIDGDNDGIAKADIGAYEYNRQPYISVWADRIIYLYNAGRLAKGKIYIKNTGEGIINYAVSSERNWLIINNPIGTSSGEVCEIDVSIDANSVELGDYKCRIKVYSDEAVNSGTEYLLNVHIGTSWTVPVDAHTIQDAVNTAVNYDYVRVMDGNYTGIGNRDINFYGKNLVLYSDRGNPENCIINCENISDGFKLVSDENEVGFEGISIINANHAIICNTATNLEINNSFLADTNYFVYVTPGQSDGRIKIRNCKFNNSNRSIYSAFIRNSGDGEIEIQDSKFSGVYFLLGGNKKLTIENCVINNSGIECDFIQKVAVKWCSIDYSSYIHFSHIYDFEMVNTNITHSIVPYGIEINDCVKVTICNCNVLNNCSQGINFTHKNYRIDRYWIKNCLIAGNEYGSRVNGTNQVNFENCTFTDNRFYGLYIADVVNVNCKNCIMWDSNAIIQYNSDSTKKAKITYSDVRGGYDGIGNINVEPRFVDAGYWDANGTPGNANDDFWVEGDYHLMSEGWRLDADANEWVYDELTSRCVDAGSPGWPIGDELSAVPVDPNNEWGENLRIDMGYYGGTAEASIAPYDWTLLPDLDNSGWVNNADLAYLESSYGLNGEKIDADLNRDGFVDIEDLALLTEDWLQHTSWANRR